MSKQQQNTHTHCSLGFVKAAARSELQIQNVYEEEREKPRLCRRRKLNCCVALTKPGLTPAESTGENIVHQSCPTLGQNAQTSIPSLSLQAGYFGQGMAIGETALCKWRLPVDLISSHSRASTLSLKTNVDGTSLCQIDRYENRSGKDFKYGN